MGNAPVLCCHLPSRPASPAAAAAAPLPASARRDRPDVKDAGTHLHRAPRGARLRRAATQRFLHPGRRVGGYFCVGALPGGQGSTARAFGTETLLPSPGCSSSGDLLKVEFSEPGKRIGGSKGGEGRDRFWAVEEG